jgi:hypothetical protein
LSVSFLYSVIWIFSFTFSFSFTFFIEFISFRQFSRSQSWAAITFNMHRTLSSSDSTWFLLHLKTNRLHQAQSHGRNFNCHPNTSRSCIMQR